MKHHKCKFLITTLVLLCANLLAAQSAVTPVGLRIDAISENLAFLVDIIGDTNLNSQFEIEYREVGDSAFLPTYKTMRAFPQSIVDGNALNRNYHAGSIVGLTEDTEYEIRLILSDPDGGNQSGLYLIKTKKELPEIINGNTIYVVPGNGGGLGTESDPYLGVQAACDAANPGDIITPAAGIYAPFSLVTNGTEDFPIVIAANPEDEVIIDGNDSDRGVVTLGVFNDSLNYIVVENLIIQNGKWGIDAQNTQYLLVRHCTIRDVDYGFINRRARGWDNGQTISDNVFEGLNDWPAPSGFIPAERGVDIRGNRNVVRYNRISHFGDGVTTNGPLSQVSYAFDIHNNDVFNIGDDLYEVDDMVANTRVWANRGTNGRMGISLAPVYGGPCYIYRNIFVNMELSTYKMNRKPAGLIMFHNSATKFNRGTTSDSGWHNTIMRNNAMASGHYCFEEYGIINNSLFDDWDYNAYYSEQSGSGGEPWFKWNNIRYNSLSDLQKNTTIEKNAIEFDPAEDIQNIKVPQDYITEVNPSDYDYSLVSTSILRDAGEQLANINDGYVFDGKPDIGAIEYGEPIPHYGPRMVAVWTSVEDDKTKDGYKVYHIGEKSKLIVEGGDLINNITIYNVKGELFLHQSKLIGRSEFNTLDFPKGYYIVLVNDKYMESFIIN